MSQEVLVCPQCGSAKWEVVDETDEFVVCNDCGFECQITDLEIVEEEMGS